MMITTIEVDVAVDLEITITIVMGGEGGGGGGFGRVRSCVRGCDDGVGMCVSSNNLQSCAMFCTSPSPSRFNTVDSAMPPSVQPWPVSFPQIYLGVQSYHNTACLRCPMSWR